MSTPESIWRERVKKHAQIHNTLGNLKVILAVLFTTFVAILPMTGLLPTNLGWVVVFLSIIPLFVLLLVLFESIFDPSFWMLIAFVRLRIWKTYTTQDLMFYREQKKTFKQGG